MKKILLIVLITFACCLYWATKSAGPSQEPVVQDYVPREAAFSDSKDRPAKTPATPHAEADETASDLLNESIRAGTMTVALQHLGLILKGESDDPVDPALQFLVRLLEEDPRNVRQALAAFEAESNPAILTALAQLLAPHVSQENNSELFDTALTLIKQSESPETRAAGLLMFSAMTDPPPNLVDSVLRLSRDDESIRVRLKAIYILGRWAASNPQKWQQLSSELVRTIDASEDELVRGHAIQLIALHTGVHEPEILGAIDEYMRFDPTTQNRGIAALALGGVTGELREPAIALLEEAFGGEPDLDTQRNILTQIARVGGQDAIFVLARLPNAHPVLDQDIRDYLEILQSSDLDFDEIYSLKFALDAERGTVVGASSHQD